MERLLETAKSDEAFGVLIMFILYVIVGFGILGTIIMMTNERRREFCVLISLGMSRLKLATVISVELLVMSLIGTVIALAVTLPVTHWFAAHPIKISGEMGDTFAQFGMEPVLPMSVDPAIFTNQMMTILVITLIAVIYPVYKILKLKINNKNE
jgi:ABC-type lipoprotein release transport system permease subunit